MDNKYRVPALEKVHDIVQAIAAQPNRLRLIDLSKRLGIHKSSMFSLLTTMEALHWVERDRADTYALGSWFGTLAGRYFQQNDLVAMFHREAETAKNSLGETIQMAKLEGGDVIYLAKSEAQTQVRLVSYPGMRLSAYATALGKALLAYLPKDALTRLYSASFPTGLTPNTVTNLDLLQDQLVNIRHQGFATEQQESVMGFCCAAAPVFGSDGEVTAAVSCSMPLHEWVRKRDIAVEEIVRLANRLSRNR